MGYSLSWLAVKGKSPEQVREQLGFRETGEREEFPESEFTAAELPGGWYLIVANHEERVVADDALQLLSAGCEAATCMVEEHVMCSFAAYRQDGHCCWQVFHGGQRGPHHLENGCCWQDGSAVCWGR